MFVDLLDVDQVNRASLAFLVMALYALLRRIARYPFHSPFKIGLGILG